MPIPSLRGTTLATLARYAVSQFFAHDIPHHAAAVTYYALFSLFPFTFFFIALLGFLDLSDLFDWLRMRFQTFFLEQTMYQVNQVLDQLQQQRTGMLSFGAITALVVATHAMLSMMKALNIVYSVEEERPFWKRYPLCVLYTIMLGSMIICVITLILVAPQALQAISEQEGLWHIVAALWAWWLRWPIIVFLMTMITAVIYGVGPDVQQRFRFVTPGAFIAVIAWISASLGFNFYVRNFANYGSLYGNVGSVIVLLLYFYICSNILLFGAEVNAAIEHFDPEGKNSGEKKMK